MDTLSLMGGGGRGGGVLPSLSPRSFFRNHRKKTAVNKARGGLSKCLEIAMLLQTHSYIYGSCLHGCDPCGIHE